ncbi:hypothetical protein Rleg9DRAFT_1735 [Rhizobium leguminosarum bv. trifolii WSM597]|uniref:Uncharacterized protein n=1 Tax=Rhizobium leguminosarum bv. trifolii WSM597 TaxID=754764 RepID=J0GZ02_RHILT|nr:hypothetical protein [Rhizobium leguminosarum]EJB02920.1 hypothetical protein Rleg9DRAFT_1735 [Rhizobium leguminosarum bv. trifolii WSM597]
MNQFDAYAHPIRGGGYRAMLRFARDAEAKPLLNKGGDPEWFKDELTATTAALRHVLAYFNGHLVSSGEIGGSSIFVARREKAERLFRKGGKVIEVRRVGSGADRD